MANKPQAFALKARIDHSVFGPGTIVQSNEMHTTIAFDEQGTRKFMTSMVELTPSSTPAPAKRTSKKKAKPAAKKAK
jgi:hypothetical protein